MDKERFCDEYCPIPVRFHEIDDDSNKPYTYSDCDLDESTCPFKNVDFKKVQG
jgi:hypothetical protein